MTVQSVQDDEQQKSSGQFNHYADGWFYEDNTGRRIGPFDTIYETVLEHWNKTERVITEPELSQIMPALCCG